MGLPGRRAALSLIPAAAAALWIPGQPLPANALEQGGAKKRVKLGKGSVPEMGTGTWAWGDGSVWGYGGYDKGLNDDSIREAWRECLGGGVTFFDTAEVNPQTLNPKPFFDTAEVNPQTLDPEPQILNPKP